MNIADMWKRGELPDINGLYRVDGLARAVNIDGPQLSCLLLGDPLDLSALMAANPNRVTEFDLCARAELPDGSGHVCCGEGGMGSEGFFGRLDSVGELMWVVSLRNSNPFCRIAINGTIVEFINNLDNSVSVDLSLPEYS